MLKDMFIFNSYFFVNFFFNLTLYVQIPRILFTPLLAYIGQKLSGLVTEFSPKSKHIEGLSMFLIFKISKSLFLSCFINMHVRAVTARGNETESFMLHYIL